MLLYNAQLDSLTHQCPEHRLSCVMPGDDVHAVCQRPQVRAMLKGVWWLQVHVRVCACVPDWHRAGVDSPSCTIVGSCKEKRAASCPSQSRRTPFSALEVVTGTLALPGGGRVECAEVATNNELQGHNRVQQLLLQLVH